ncbi:DNA repair metallo-beta-lactamase-domain-containing protein [Protomyces lactucae-debilis]|uniref:DNA repair metallo-beta-lactamase-domain-containing protein n=1 Tax=Protomyces lactucae-debilis TaxID=2754530 RepID=A0A1Y2FF89_PROLT|nr:DNA repair metallo-beta-lactamase-domain-containing protein [Protomyces lactucae-debilis]ORY82630.1 DNA repair metallo-beta-lactamase-domain-containing protein [Protomyces lactucae-debilis]
MSASPVRDSIGEPIAVASDVKAVATTSAGASHGPFTLEDDDDRVDPTDEEFAALIASQDGAYREEQDTEIELREEVDHLDDETYTGREDETWTWQEYHAEHFGKADAGIEESVLCPVCGEQLISMAEHDRSAHVNACLDLPAPLKEENAEDSDAKPDLKPIPDQKPGLKAEDSLTADGSKDAYKLLMVSHSEEKRWADAAKTELAQRGTRYKTRVCPFYKILSPFPIAVDAFKYGRVPGIGGYYLSHFHSDHYGGLSSSWDAGPIYCSTVTGNLCIQQLRVKPEYIVKLNMNTPHMINGVTVTLIDANHCPGSTLFFFEGEVRGKILRYLHCGDFRATPTQLMHPAIAGKRIDALYLDTTYLAPKYAFPSQEEVIEACCHVCKDLAGILKPEENPVGEARQVHGLDKFLKKDNNLVSTAPATVPAKPKGRLLVVVGTYSIGKERIVVGIAKALGSKIYADHRKRDILACLEDPILASLVTADPAEAQVHMTYLQEIRAETLQAYCDSLAPHFARVVGFRGTGWTYAPPRTRLLDSPSVSQILSWKPTYDFRDMHPARGSTNTSMMFGVAYSEHSSFRELMCFCLSADLGRVIPTVNIGSAKSREKMKVWIDRWEVHKRKEGRLPMQVGQKYF